MMTYPVMVAGPGKFDTDLMTVGGGKVFPRVGQRDTRSSALCPARSERVRLDWGSPSRSLMGMAVIGRGLR